MKTGILSIAMLLVIAFVAGDVFAQEEKDQPKGRIKTDLGRGRRAERPQGPASERRQYRRERARGTMHKQQLKKVDEQLDKMRQRHTGFVAELTEIKQLAQSEGAEKTAERLSKLIDKKQKQFDDKLKRLEKRRNKIRKQIEKQATEHRRKQEQSAQAREQQEQLKSRDTEEDKDKDEPKAKGKAKGKKKRDK